MKFLSIKEYFYKLNTIGFILLLLPLGVFIFLYYRSIAWQPWIVDQQSAFMLIGTFIIIFLVDLTIVHWVWKAKMNKLKTNIELTRKMDGYFVLTMLKMSVYCGCSLLMAIGFFLTQDSMFTGGFILFAIGMVFQWPSPALFCKHLDLRGSEREMVLQNTDMPKK